MISGPKHLERINVYVPGATADDIRREYGIGHAEKLASNENPFGPSPLGLAAATESLTKSHLYPDGGMNLRLALAEHHNTKPECITVNNGSDAIIHQVMRTFLLPGETALSSRGGFISFGIAVTSAGFEPQYVELKSGYRFDVEALISAITPATKIIYIPNPNNPTGTIIPRDEMDWFLTRVPRNCLVIIDEAYHEYAVHLNADDYPRSEDYKQDNVITLRTFSKAYGLASLRVGYAIGSSDVIQLLLKTKLPFDPSGPAAAAAQAALHDHVFLNTTLDTNKEGLEILSTAAHLNGYTIATSSTNFIMFECGSQQHATAFHISMLQHGFITRPLRGGFDLPTCIRITTGTHHQNIRLASALQTLSEPLNVSDTWSSP
ncbi:MAG: aminotransferase class I/II-fold pyridoxal phosphate-dependent enzyme [Ignavibacteria bacterium]|nr:aminotransferase class I/II-fold pyridoxal phosphate-dependent enzyme [Ignavibacteria bacterium]